MDDMTPAQRARLEQLADWCPAVAVEAAAQKPGHVRLTMLDQHPDDDGGYPSHAVRYTECVAPTGRVVG
jgi:hypothetical protein